MFLHSISSNNDSPISHWPCNVVSSSFGSPTRQTYRNRSMEGPDITASSSSSSPSSLHSPSLSGADRFEDKARNDQDVYDERKPRSLAKCMSAENHTSPSFDMRMTFSEDCEDDHRAFHASSALGILDGDHIGIGIIPYAPEFLLQSYQHFASQAETHADEEEYDSSSSHCNEMEEKEVESEEQKESEELQGAFLIDHYATMQTDNPKGDVLKVWRRSSRVKAAKVTRASKSPAKFKITRKASSRHVREEPAMSSSEIQPTERELESAVNRRQKEALQQWYGKLNELNQYRIAKGHCNVPQQYPPNPQLGIVSSVSSTFCFVTMVHTQSLFRVQWVNKQRMEKKFMDDGEKSSMTEDRKLQLEKIGFTWAKRKGDYSWNEKFRELEDFKREHGHVDVPTKYEENKALGRWVSTQRSQYKLFIQGERSHMTQDRLDELVSIGFKFDMTAAPPKPANRSRRLQYIRDEESDEAYSV